MPWYSILLISFGSVLLLGVLSVVFYKVFFKRFYDIFFSLIAIIVLSPIFVVLIIIGAIKMKGNPFFTQNRPGKNEKIFKLIKFRTMTNEKDKDGNLLSDEKRLTKYGKTLRATSLDELPELFNILIGNMSIVGPRPLLVQYLPLYNEEQKHRHDVLPGLTGYAQSHGRNAISWQEKFKFDIFYVKNISLWLDIKIIFCTIKAVFAHKNISSNTSATMEFFTGNDD